MSTWDIIAYAKIAFKALIFSPDATINWRKGSELIEIAILGFYYDVWKTEGSPTFLSVRT